MKYGQLQCGGKMDWSCKQIETLYTIKFLCCMERLVGWSVPSAGISQVEAP